jgi:hypothetical protein
MVAKRTTRSERIQTINQARAVVVTGPDDIRVRFARHTTDALVAELAALRPRPGSMVRPRCRCARSAAARSSSMPSSSGWTS